MNEKYLEVQPIVMEETFKLGYGDVNDWMKMWWMSYLQTHIYITCIDHERNIIVWVCYYLPLIKVNLICQGKFNLF
jgi:hypothetical protein